MLKWLKSLLKNYEEMERKNLQAGIINVLHPMQGMYTYIDKQVYKEFLERQQKENDRQEALRKTDRKS
tara:strand:- start:2793 stop:2996 length:204 start_codon:yes stop_codon:yes gene_type:complete